MTEDQRTYGIGEHATDTEISSPDLPYRPRDPRSYSPPIGLIGCGAITEQHLAAYREAGYRVTAMMDPVRAHAEARRAEFYPEAEVFTDRAELLATDVEVVDIAAHPDVRGPIVADALRAGKHVLSQKPFALDLDEGERLVQLADECRVKLAVNQNGRWAPHLGYMREAVRLGLLGEVAAVDAVLHWDHSWTVGTKLDETPHLILFDFAVHWFDFLCTVFDKPARRVTACIADSPGQKSKQPMLGQAIVEYDHARAVLAFNGDSPHFQCDTTIVSGTRGSVHATGRDFVQQEVVLHLAEGIARPRLGGGWFPDGFHGTMGELLCAIEEKREPMHSARNNLQSLALAFAACESSLTGQPCAPGNVRRIK